jgi:alginate O-acetyltransferase complex protein AlgI
MIFVISISVTFLISSLWHGAAWTFIVWGMWLSLLIILERFVLFPLKLQDYKILQFLSWILVILEVWIGWVFFRSNSFSQAWDIISKMFAFDGGWEIGLDVDQKFFLILALMPELLYFIKTKVVFINNRIPSKTMEVIFYSALFLMCIYMRGPGANFIYFQF